MPSPTVANALDRETLLSGWNPAEDHCGNPMLSVGVKVEMEPMTLQPRIEESSGD